MKPTCHPDLPHAARRLCENCYSRARYHDNVADYPRLTRSRDEFLDEYVLLRGQGYDRWQIADRLGITRGAVDKALSRARRASDPRAA